MAFKGGVVLGPVSLNATGSGTTNIGGTSNSGTISIGNSSSGAVTIGCGTAGISVGTTANAHSSTFGSTNSTSSTTVQSGSGALNVTSTNGSLTVNSGTGALGISTDASATTVNLGTGAANKTVSLGSTGTGSTLTLNAASSATYTGPNFTSSTSQSGAYKIFSWQNSDNTNAGSHSLIRSQSGGTSGGNPAFCAAEGSSRAYAWGIDPADSASLKETTAAADSTIPGSGTLLRKMTSGGAQTLPLQPAFLATLTNTLSNITGDGTTYTVIFDTKVFDQNNNYNNSTGVFTAPVTGRYHFSVGLFAQQLGAAFTDFRISLITSNRSYAFIRMNPSSTNTSGFLSFGGSSYVDMDITDTAIVQFNVGGSTKTIGLLGDSNSINFFGGTLIA